MSHIRLQNYFFRWLRSGSLFSLILNDPVLFVSTGGAAEIQRIFDGVVSDGEW